MTELRTDELRALRMLAEDGLWLGATAAGGPRLRAWVQCSKYRGDEIPVGWDTFARLEAAGYLAPGRRVRGTARQYRINASGRAVLAPPQPRAPALAGRVGSLVDRSVAALERSRLLRAAAEDALARARMRVPSGPAPTGGQGAQRR